MLRERLGSDDKKRALRSDQFRSDLFLSGFGCDVGCLDDTSGFDDMRKVSKGLTSPLALEVIGLAQRLS